MPRQEGIKQAAANRKAFHDYFVLDRQGRFRVIH